MCDCPRMNTNRTKKEKATPVIYHGESNIFTSAGAIIGWIHPNPNGAGFWSQYGMKKKSSFMGALHATKEAAEACIRKINAGVAKNTVLV